MRVKQNGSEATYVDAHKQLVEVMEEEAEIRMSE